MKIAKRASVFRFAQTRAGISPYHGAWVTLMPYVFEPGGAMLGMGVVGTIIVILVIVWLVRRV